MAKVSSLAQVLDRLRVTVLADLDSQGFVVPQESAADVEEVVLAAFRLKSRSIIPRIRAVRWSRELKARTLESRVADALQMIAEESEQGLDLNPRLTRKYFRAGFNDPFLNDLGLQHLHLGAPSGGKNGQAGGTRELLFTLVGPDELLFVDVRDHDGFKQDDLVRLVYRNWPEYLEPYRVHGVVGLERPVSAAERVTLRESNIAVPIEIDGSVFWPPGGGTTTAGTGTMAVRSKISFMKRIRGGHSWLVENADRIAEHIRDHARVSIDVLDVEVVPQEGGPVFREITTGAVIDPSSGTVALPTAQEPPGV